MQCGLPPGYYLNCGRLMKHVADTLHRLTMYKHKDATQSTGGGDRAKVAEGAWFVAALWALCVIYG